MSSSMTFPLYSLEDRVSHPTCSNVVSVLHISGLPSQLLVFNMGSRIANQVLMLCGKHLPREASLHPKKVERFVYLSGMCSGLGMQEHRA